MVPAYADGSDIKVFAIVAAHAFGLLMKACRHVQVVALHGQLTQAITITLGCSRLHDSPYIFVMLLIGRWPPKWPCCHQRP